MDLKTSIDLVRPDLTISLRLDQHAPRTARLQVAQLDLPPPDLRDAVMLLTSEMVTRAVRQRDRAADKAVELRAWMS